MSMLRPKKDAVEVVVAKLPPPDRLKKPGGGGRPTYDDNGDAEDSSDVGESSAFESFVAALGVKPKDAEEARSALDDYIRMCVQKHMEEAHAEEEPEGDEG